MQIKVDGQQLLDAISKSKRSLSRLLKRFDEVPFAFPNEPRPTPQDIDKQYVAEAHRLTLLKELQAKYNNAVLAEYRDADGKTHFKSLAYFLPWSTFLQTLAAKYVPLTTEGKAANYYGAPETRDKDTIVAVRQMSCEDATKRQEQLQDEVLSLKNIIHRANCTQLSMDVPDDFVL